MMMTSNEDWRIAAQRSRSSGNSPRVDEPAAEQNSRSEIAVQRQPATLPIGVDGRIAAQRSRSSGNPELIEPCIKARIAAQRSRSSGNSS